MGLKTARVEGYNPRGGQASVFEAKTGLQTASKRHASPGYNIGTTKSILDAGLLVAWDGGQGLSSWTMAVEWARGGRK